MFLFFKKYVLANARLGTKTMPYPKPQQSACARKTCQYVLQRLSMNRPTMYMVLPITFCARKKPASRLRPLTAPMPKTRNTCTVPIQATLLELPIRIVST